MQEGIAVWTENPAVSLPDRYFIILLFKMFFSMNNKIVLVSNPWIFLELNFNPGENGGLMKTEKNILTAFILNLSFSIFEFIGGIFTNSTAILSDAVHDLGDAASIGLSWFLERKSKKKADSQYTYGYARYSVLGAVITTVILLSGSITVAIHAIDKIIHPSAVNSNGMMVFALFGLVINFAAAWFTREGDSVNQKAVNLHMLEDVLGWAVVLIGSIVIHFTHWTIIDPLMSLGVSAFIFMSAWKNLKESLDIFLEKVPDSLSPKQVEKELEAIPGVINIHHIHLWSLDGENSLATLHVVSDTQDPAHLKEEIRHKLEELGIGHVTIELESSNEGCKEKDCEPVVHPEGHSHSHHHPH